MIKKIALVTGAGSGIGRATSLALLEDGWTVVLAGRRLHMLEETADLAQSFAGQAFPVLTDIGNPGSVDNLFTQIHQLSGRLDLLFNNAGDNVDSIPLEEVEYDDWQRVVQTNVTGTFLCSQHAFRLMKDQIPMGGRIINNGAPSAYVPRPDAAPFTVTKPAIAGLTSALSLEGRKYDIACGQIDIGNVEPSEPHEPHAAKQANGTLMVEPTMDISYVADTVLMMANLPLDTNVQSVMLMPTKMPYIGRG